MTRAIDKTRLTPKYDRRKKVTPEIAEEVLDLYHQGLAIRAIARQMDGIISRRTIQYIIKPEIYQKLLKDFKFRRLDGRYKPSKNKWKMTMREHRAYKKDLLTKGLIK